MAPNNGDDQAAAEAAKAAQEEAARKSTTKGALFKAFAKRSAKSEDRAAPVRAGQLLKRVGGSIKDAAKAVGRSPRTFKRWLDGQATPKADSNEALNRANREALVPEGRRKRILASADDRYLVEDEESGQMRFQKPEGVTGKGGFVLTAVIRISKDERERSVNLGPYLSSDHMQELMDAFMAGNERAAVDVLEEGLENWVPEAELLSTSSLSFSPVEWESEDE
ncbi:hypothetical protein ABR737_43445 [Streptomyces sp. Edi2]|uniref:helix-turn-helix domain-containing protein n=1 Tax=Streptomyces sp. Edi2 TaxID=3162528 RepID=UPI0033056EB5